MTCIVEFDSRSAAGLQSTLGAETVVFTDLTSMRTHLAATPAEHLVVVGPSVDLSAALELAEHMRVHRPTLGVVLVRRRLETSLLAESLRAGIRDVIAEDDIAGLSTSVRRAKELSAALRDQAVQDGTGVAASHGRIVTVFAAKGGSGKTTVSTNIAVALAQGGNRKVALLDLDLAFGDVAIAMGLSPTHTIADAVSMEASLDGAALRSLVTSHPSGISVLVAPLDPSKAEGISTSLVIRAIDLLSVEYDYVIIDCPPALNDHVLAAFDVSDIVALVATLDVPSIKNLKLTLDTLTQLNYPTERLKIALNRANAKVGLEIKDVETAIGMPAIGLIPSSVDVPASTNRGAVLVDENPNHPFSVAVRAYVEVAVIGDAEGGNTNGVTPLPTNTPSQTRRGLLRRRAS